MLRLFQKSVRSQKSLQRFLPSTHFSPKKTQIPRHLWTTSPLHSLPQGKITIGGVSAPIFEPSRPEYVPAIPNDWFQQSVLDSQPALSYIKWMMQKANVGQDMILLGGPGFFRRQLALRFCEISRREYEFISLSRDTSESDIKQRREMKDKNAYFIDQCAVNAALNGRVLIIEGLEKAERNILPILVCQ